MIYRQFWGPADIWSAILKLFQKRQRGGAFFTYLSNQRIIS